MADFDATGTPQDVAAEIGTPRGYPYRLRIQNVDANARLFMREAATQPAGTERAHVVGPGETFRFRVFADPAPASWGWWAWSPDPGGCACVVGDDPAGF